MKPIACALGLLLAAATMLTAEEIPLARDGTSSYCIVLPANPDAVQKTAARELQEHLARVTGATLKVASETEVAVDMPQIAYGIPSASSTANLIEIKV